MNVLQVVEIKHGRLAMMAVLVCAMEVCEITFLDIATHTTVLNKVDMFNRRSCLAPDLLRASFMAQKACYFKNTTNLQRSVECEIDYTFACNLSTLLKEYLNYTVIYIISAPDL